MTQELVIVLPDSASIAAQWLSHCSSDTGVTLCWLEEAQRQDAAELRASFGCVKNVCGLTEVDDALLAATTRTAILPAPLIYERLRFAEGEMAHLAPYYPAVRQLWQAGLRCFQFTAHGSTLTVDVPHLLDDFLGKHKGQRCFVVGNGPSLNKIDMRLLRDEITFGSNRCYIGYEKWGFPFRYWGVMDRLQIEQYGQEYEQTIREGVQFMPYEYLPMLRMHCACPVNLSYKESRRPLFSDDPAMLHMGYTVTHMLLQVAMMMGCDPIILVGVDHRYPVQKWRQQVVVPPPLRPPWRKAKSVMRATVKYGKLLVANPSEPEDPKAKPKAPALWNAEANPGPTHFAEAYTGQRRQFVRPRLQEAEEAFRVAAEHAQSRNVRIWNATPNSALKAFPKVNYGDLFK